MGKETLLEKLLQLGYQLKRYSSYLQLFLWKFSDQTESF